MSRDEHERTLGQGPGPFVDPDRTGGRGETPSSTALATDLLCLVIQQRARATPRSYGSRRVPRPSPSAVAPLVLLVLLVTLRGEVTRLEGQREGQEETLARRLRVMYRVHAQGGALPLILSGDDPVTRAVAVRHLASLAALDARLIREYRGTSERLADRKGREEARQRELAALHAEAQTEQAEVDREAAKRRTLLARVRDERAYHERMVGELTEASRRREALLRGCKARQGRLCSLR